MKLSGNETAILTDHKLLFKIGRYRLYRVKLAVHTRWFLVDHPIHAQYYDGLKRITDNFFVCIGKEKK